MYPRRPAFNRTASDTATTPASRRDYYSQKPFLPAVNGYMDPRPRYYSTATVPSGDLVTVAGSCPPPSQHNIRSNADDYPYRPPAALQPPSASVFQRPGCRSTATAPPGQLPTLSSSSPLPPSSFHNERYDGSHNVISPGSAMTMQQRPQYPHPTSSPTGHLPNLTAICTVSPPSPQFGPRPLFATPHGAYPNAMPVVASPSPPPTVGYGQPRHRVVPKPGESYALLGPTVCKLRWSSMTHRSEEILFCGRRRVGAVPGV